MGDVLHRLRADKVGRPLPRVQPPRDRKRLRRLQLRPQQPTPGDGRHLEARPHGDDDVAAAAAVARKARRNLATIRWMQRW